MTIENVLPVLIGIPWMALCCWLLSWRIPLLQVETRAHATTLPMDGLRGVLASSVFFHHAYITYFYVRTGQWAEPASIFYGQLGPTAVTMFFFISGFLFWKKMLENPASLHPRRLWPNRLRRIMPAYWTAAAFAFLAIAIASGFHLRQPLTTMLGRALPWISVGFPCQPNINGIAQEPITAGVYWTLRVELLFYLVLPGLIWFRRGWRPIGILVAALAANRIMHHLTFSGLLAKCVVDNLERFTSATVSSFSIGGVAAYLVLYQSRWPRLSAALRSHWMAALGTVLIVVHLAFLKPGYSWREPILLAPAFLMIASGNSLWTILSSRPMRCLGQISYSLYIFHGLILYSLTSVVNHYHPIALLGIYEYWALMLAISVVVVIVCTFTYLYIEKPFFQKRVIADAQTSTRAVTVH